jgi:tRNA A58 N-methylase Trm61
MKDVTPARDIREKDLLANVDMLRNVLKPLGAKRPPKVVEWFTGVGMMTAFLEGWAPAAEVVSFELDEECRRLAAERVALADLRRGDAMKVALAELETGDGAVLDFNLMTLLQAETKHIQFFGSLFSRRPAFATITDSAVSKMHLNFASYGLAKPDWSEYVKKWDAFARKHGMRVAHSVSASRASMLLVVPR